MIVLGPIEYDDAALKCIGIGRIGKEAGAEIVRHDRELHYGAVEQVAAEHDQPGFRLQWIRDRPDHGRIFGSAAGDVLGDRTAVAHDRRAIQEAAFIEHAHDGGNAAGMVIVLAEVLPGRLQIDEQRNLGAMIFPIREAELNTHVAGDCIQVDRGVRRPADGRVDPNGIEECGAREDVGRLPVGPDHLDDPPAGFPGHLLAVAIGRRDRRRTRQRHSECLGQRVHRGGGAHRVAVAGRRRRRRDELYEAAIVDLSGGKHLARLPDDGARSCPLALVPAIEHRADRKRYGWNVDRGRGH